MLNQVIIVGRVTGIYLEDNIIEVTVPRHTPNEQDIIPCTLSSSIMDNVKEYCKQGDIIGVKGRLVSEGTNVSISAEKITFLSSKSRGGEDDGSSE